MSLEKTSQLPDLGHLNLHLLGETFYVECENITYLYHPPLLSHAHKPIGSLFTQGAIAHGRCLSNEHSCTWSNPCPRCKQNVSDFRYPSPTFYSCPAQSVLQIPRLLQKSTGVLQCLWLPPRSPRHCDKKPPKAMADRCKGRWFFS